MSVISLIVLQLVPGTPEVRNKVIDLKPLHCSWRRTP
jgi:hypothetical protein